MNQREKIIKGLEICSEHGSWHGLDCELNEAYKDCPYRGCETGCVVTIAKDALTLLKEQEPAKPIWINTNYERSCKCGKCGALINTFFKYCHECGRAVKWDA